MSSNVPRSTPSSAFSADVLTIITGTTFAQIITILAAPIITRLYGPETFGLLAIFTSLTSIIGVVACMRYELAIMLPESDVEAANVFGVCIIFIILVSLVSIIPLVLFQQSLLQILNTPQLDSFLWLIPPTILIGGFFLALNNWNTRTKNFHRLSIARVLGSGSSTGTQLGIGVAGYASGGALIGASILGQFVATLALGIQILRDHLSFFKHNITWNGMGNVLKRYSNFPKYDIWSALLNTISWQIPIFLLSYFFSTAIVGYYSLGMMIIQLPMSFIGSAIAQVFYQRAAKAKIDDTLRPLVENLFNILLILGLFPIIVLMIIGKNIFLVFFGPQWEVAGIYVQILSIWALVWFISSPLSTIISVFEIQSWGLYLNILIFLTRVISLIIGGIFSNVIIALLLFSISGIIVYGYLCIKIMEYSRIPIICALKIVFNRLGYVLPAGIILLSLVFLNVAPIISVCVACLLGLIYYIFVIKNEPLLYGQFENFFMNKK